MQVVSARLWPFHKEPNTVEMTREVVLLVLSASVVCFSLEYFRALVFRSCGEACSSAAAGSDSCSGQTDGDELLADRGTRWRTPLRPLPSGAEPRSLERACR